MSTKLLVLFLLNLFILPGHAGDGVGIVAFVKGKVVITNKEGIEREATAKMMFREQEKIATSKGALVILKLMDKSTIKLEQESVVDVVSLITNYKSGIVGSSNLIMSSGKALIDVVKQFSGPPSLEIQTSKSVSFGVRGTSFLIDIDPVSKNVWCSVRNGIVQAFDHNNDDSEVIDGGKTIAIEKGQTLTKPIKYQWAEKINWNIDPQKGDIESTPPEVAQTRTEEIKTLENVIRNRRPRPFKKQLEEQRKRIINGKRTELQPGEKNIDANGDSATTGNSAATTAGTAATAQNAPQSAAGANSSLPAHSQQAKKAMAEGAGQAGDGSDNTNRENAQKACQKMSKAFPCEATKAECPSGFFQARKLGAWKVCVKKKYK